MYGGYKVYMRIRDGVWQPDSDMVSLEDMFDDIYAMPPGSTTKINSGTLKINYQNDLTGQAPLIVLVYVPSPGVYSYHEMSHVSGYWGGTPVQRQPW